MLWRLEFRILCQYTVIIANFRSILLIIHFCLVFSSICPAFSFFLLVLSWHLSCCFYVLALFFPYACLIYNYEDLFTLLLPFQCHNNIFVLWRSQKPTLDRNPTMYGKVECLSMENYTSTKLNDDIYEFSMTLISFGLSNWPFPFKLLPWKVELTFSRNMSIQHTFWTFQQWPCLE